MAIGFAAYGKIKKAPTGGALTLELTLNQIYLKTLYTLVIFHPLPVLAMVT